jgi:hypothetical protein
LVVHAGGVATADAVIKKAERGVNPRAAIE